MILTKQDVMEAAGLKKLQEALGGSLASQVRRMEQERASWMKSISQSQSLADHAKKLVADTSFASQMANHLNEVELARRQSITKMLDPLEALRKSFLEDSAWKLAIKSLNEPTTAAARLLERAAPSNAVLDSLHLIPPDAMESARKVLADSALNSSIVQMMKGFDAVNRRWMVPDLLLNSLGPLKALQEQIGRLSIPVIDVASAAALAKVLGHEGVQAQLSAIGINPDGTLNDQAAHVEPGIGLSRRSLELMALLSFILAVLVPVYQEMGAGRWQEGTDKSLGALNKEIAAQSATLKAQQETIAALTKLVERALAQEAKRQDERLVVRDRVTLIRAKPEHGSSIEGKLLPREVVRPLQENGKWVEFEYYHWLRQEYRTGWALKKYFERVPSNHAQP